MFNVKISSEFKVPCSENNTIVIARSIECGEGDAAISKAFQGSFSFLRYGI